MLNNLRNLSSTTKNLDSKTHFGAVGVTSVLLSFALLGVNGAAVNAAPIEQPKITTSVSSLSKIHSQTVQVSINDTAPVKSMVHETFTATPASEIAAIIAAEEAAKAAAEAETARVAAEAAQQAQQQAAQRATQNAPARAQVASNGSSRAAAKGVAPGQVIPANGILSAAASWVGVVPYGSGNHPSDSFSCDGFVQYVFAQNGISLPRGVTAQANRGTRISASDAKPGDLLVWPGQHIGIYAGNGKMYDSPKPGMMVQYRAIWGNPYFVRL